MKQAAFTLAALVLGLGLGWSLHRQLQPPPPPPPRAGPFPPIAVGAECREAGDAPFSITELDCMMMCWYRKCI